MYRPGPSPSPGRKEEGYNERGYRVEKKVELVRRKFWEME